MCKLIIITIVSIAALPISIIFFSIFAIYRKFIDWALRKKYGSKYGGLLGGGDSNWAAEDEISKSIASILYMVEFDSSADFFQSFKNHFRERLFDDPNRLIKFTSVLKTAGGYPYLLKDEYTIDECMRAADDEIKDQEDLQKVLSKYANVLLPKDHSALWEVLIWNRPIQWGRRKCHPVLFRFQHCMTDGVNFLSLFSALLSDETILEEFPKIPKVPFFKKNLIRLYFLVIAPLFAFSQHLLKRAESNGLHGQRLSGEKLLTWKVADRALVDKVKRIKRKIPQTRFADVIFAAASASFEKYFIEKRLRMPENLTIGYPALSALFIEPPPGKYKVPALTNQFAAAMVPTPIAWWTWNLREKLEEIRNRHNSVLQDVDVHVNHLGMNVMVTLLPIFLVRILKKMVDFTVVFSNMPPVPYWTVCDGHLVADVIGWLPHYNKIGVGFTFFSYGENVQLSFSVDKALMNSVEDANEFLERLCENIDKMYKEINN